MPVSRCSQSGSPVAAARATRRLSASATYSAAFAAGHGGMRRHRAERPPPYELSVSGAEGEHFSRRRNREEPSAVPGERRRNRGLDRYRPAIGAVEDVQRVDLPARDEVQRSVGREERGRRFDRAAPREHARFTIERDQKIGSQRDVDAAIVECPRRRGRRGQRQGPRGSVPTSGTGVGLASRQARAMASRRCAALTSLLVSPEVSEGCWASGQTPHAVSRAQVVSATETQYLVVRLTNTTI